MAKQASKGYTVNLVGEQYFPNGTKGLRVGDTVLLLHELGNPHDANALLAMTESDIALGYIPADSFVRRVLLEDFDGIHAIVREIDRSGPFPQIRLTVRVVDADDPGNGFGRVDYTPRQTVAQAPQWSKSPPIPWQPIILALGSMAVVFLLLKLFT